MIEAAPCRALPAVSLAEVLDRFRREAVPGVCDTGRYRCRYYIWGQGPPLLLIPGLADDALSFVLLVARLAGRFRCIAYNLPAGTDDGARLSTYRHDDLVADAFAVLDHEAAPRAYVLGSSFGSTIALAAAARTPERLPRLVLQGGFARRPLAAAEVFLARLARYWPGTMEQLPLRKQVLRRNHHAPFADLSPELWDYFLTRSNAFPIRAVAYRALMIHQLDLRPLLASVEQPVLVVCGRDDPLVGPGCEQVLTAGLPHAGRVELAGCGHNPLFTHPEALAELVSSFLSPPAIATGCAAICGDEAVP
jgi:pimeloyl-ACP methyl ester carboxylesterase